MRVASVAAIFLAALAQVCGTTQAAADRREQAADAPTFLIFSGGDLWREGGFLHGGLLWSPGGLDEDGFTLKLLFGSGAYRYRSGALGDAEVTGRQLSAAFMPGWRFKREFFELTVFAGLDAQNHELSPTDPSAALQGSHTGVRAGFDFWYEPTRSTMLALDASVSMIGPSYTMRGAYGWRFSDRGYFGPETGMLVCDDYRQYRFGLQMIAFKTTSFDMSAAAGYARDSSKRSGAYGRLGLLRRR
jgi:hypothetical protein